MSEMTGWPKLDGNIILYLEIILLVCVFTMNGADEALYLKGESHVAGQGSFGFLVSSYTVHGCLAHLILKLTCFRTSWLVGHILVVFAF